MSNSIAEAASHYAQQGLAVYPASADKKALIQGWNGRSAVRDPYKALSLFAALPHAQLGIATGPSGLVVLDIDPRNGGEKTWREICGEIGLETFDGCPSASTPGGGRHIYFRAPFKRLRSRAHALGLGVDLIGSGGGVLAPPSVRGTRAYRWHTVDGDLPDLESMPELPPSLLARLDERSLRHVTAKMGNRIASQVEPGRRNDTLMRIGSKLRWRFELSEDELTAALLSLNRRCAPPLSESEVVMICQSVARRPAASVDPIAWLAAWLPVLGTEREVRVASALAALGDFATGELTPSGSVIERRSGLRTEKYYVGRRALADRGAIRIIGRRGRAPVIEFVMPANADSALPGSRSLAA